ncbi:MAG: acetylxylan esterase [Myxococcota bacterium]|jgi:dienelactone hydrolase
MRKNISMLVSAALVTAACFACGGSISGGADGGDAGRRDAGRDAGAADSGQADGAGYDTGDLPDASPDGAPSDAGTADGGPVAPDASTDSGISDAGVQDAGPSDGGAWKTLFDMDHIRDQATANCQFTNHRTTVKDFVSVDLWDVSYNSWESIDGELKPILIRGFASKPVSKSSNIPGVVQAHGLGGYAKEENATGPAALLGTFVIAYTGPGGGDPKVPATQSEGLPASYNNGYRMFDTLKDVRGSWFWGHATAAMRAETCLESRDEVDKTRLGITGFSAGSVVSLLSSGADDRIKVAVPLSGTLAWDVATLSPTAWQNELLKGAGLTNASTEWKILIDQMIAPSAVLANTKTKIMMMDGTTDEFFPLTAYMSSFGAIPGDEKRSSFAANFDHGCYNYSVIEKPQTIEDRASLRATGGQRMWFGHWFGTDAQFSRLPAVPAVALTPGSGVTLVAATADDGGSNYDIENVTFWASNDASYNYFSQELDKGSGVWSKLIPMVIDPANTFYFVDVQYKTRELIPRQFSVSSAPALPAGVVPKIRAMSNCQ